MPRLPTPPTDDDAYKKNITEQYEALGRFVEAFEAMVNEVRQSSILLLSTESEKSRLVDVAFHHPALSAKPLFEIMRALIAEYMSLSSVKIATKDQHTIRSILAEIAAEYSDLANIRNTLLHGTWYIGYVSDDDPNAERFFVQKYKPTKTGLTKDGAPKSARELIEFKKRCEKTRNWISILLACLPFMEPDQPASYSFVFKNAKWWLVRYGAPETLR